MKIENSYPQNFYDKSYTKATKSSVFIDLGWSANASSPPSSLIAAIRAIVFILASASYTFIDECFADQALVQKVLKVNTSFVNPNQLLIFKSVSSYSLVHFLKDIEVVLVGIINCLLASFDEFISDTQLLVSPLE